MKKFSVLQGILFGILVLALWNFLYVFGVDIFGIWKPYAMPSPLGVWKRFGELLSDGSLLKALGHSLLRGFTGYLISVVLGAILGFLINHFQFLHKNLRPIIMGIQTLPSVCWVPFSILWFGLSESAILFVVIMGSMFSLAIGADNALSNVQPIYLKAASTLGASKSQMYFHVIIPAAIPEMLSALKQGWSFAWRALMSGEVMTTCIGLGQTLMTGRNLADINQVMLVMVVIILVGIVIDKLVFSIIEQRLYKSRGMN